MTFDFDNGPVIQPKTPRRKVAGNSISVPTWGTFLILLSALLGVAGWGSWRFYDKNYRQPRFVAIRRLYADWSSCNVRFDRTRHRELEEQIAALKKTGSAYGGDPLSEKDRYREIAARQREMRGLEYSMRRDLSLASQLDEKARQVFGVPAKDLPRLLPE